MNHIIIKLNKKEIFKMTNNEELDTNIRIVKEINNDNQKSANELWIDEKTLKDSKYNDKFYQDFYPIIVKTSSQQLNTVKEICHICDTNLITLLTDTITKTQNKLPKFKKTKDKDKLTLKDVGVYINNLIYETHKLYNKSLLINESDWISIDNIDNKVRDQFESNIQNQLIIFNLTNNQTYKNLLNLDQELISLKRLSISDIFKRLINALINTTSEALMNKTNKCDKIYIFSLTEKNNK